MPDSPLHEATWNFHPAILTTVIPTVMSIDLNDPDIQCCLQSDTIEKHYSADCLPLNCVEPSNPKACMCLFERIDINIYDYEARMIAFRTTQPRLQAWIKALNLYFYEHMGKQSDKVITWVDSPQTISPAQPLKSISVDVKGSKDERLFKLTFFLKSAFIQIQGNSHMDFFNRDFPIILKIMHKIAGPLSVIDDGQSINDEIEETGVKDLIDCTPEQQHTSMTSKGSNADELPNKCDDTARTPDYSNNIVQKSDLNRLEDIFSTAILQLGNSCSENTSKIISVIESYNAHKIDKHDQESVSKQNTIQTLENRIRSLKDENLSLDSKLKLEKSNSMLRDEQNSLLLAHEKTRLNEIKEQLKDAMENANWTQEQFDRVRNDQLKQIENLTLINKDLTVKLGNSMDEVIQLKAHIASLMDEKVATCTAAWDISPTHHAKEIPLALLIGTSNVEGIKEEKLTNHANVRKVIRYTMKDTLEYILTTATQPTVLVLHSITNDLKVKRPQECVDEMFNLASKVCAKWPSVKIVLSSTTPRCDSANNTTNGQLINVLLKQKFSGVDNVFFVDHSNMLFHGNPNKQLINEDGIHLNNKGISFLAGNIKRAVHLALEVPLPFNRSRGRSRSRGAPRGRGRGKV